MNEDQCVSIKSGAQGVWVCAEREMICEEVSKSKEEGTGKVWNQFV